MKSLCVCLLLLGMSMFVPSMCAAQSAQSYGLVTYADGSTYVDASIPALGANSRSLFVLYENLFGETQFDIGTFDSKGNLMGTFEVDADFSITPFVDAIIVEGDGTVAWAGMLVLNDTNTLGDDWEPVDPEDEENWTGCEDVALDIRSTLGCYAEIYIITPNPPAPLLGGYRDVEPGWAEHHVVVKDGRVYDGFGPADGVPIDEYKELWEFPSDINFGF
ncbi:MAG: hypothetical protein ACKN9U_07505 [Pirellulaceae bacterium]